MRFAKFTDANTGRPVWVNPARVEAVHDTDESLSAIALASVADLIEVASPAKDVVKELQRVAGAVT